MRSPWHEAPRRRAGWYGLIAAVALAHLLFGAKVAAGMIGWNGGANEPKRIDVSLVTELSPTAPPTLAVTMKPPVEPVSKRAVHAPRPRPVASQPQERAAVKVADAASDAADVATHDDTPAAVEPAMSPPETPADDAAAVAEAASAASAASVASAASAATSSASAASGPSASASAVAGPAQPALDWPPSTRLSYTLTGLFRNGPLYGSSIVEWRRDGTHYQVQFDIHVSPFFDQHVFSDGQIAEDGLRPRHYDESRKVPLADPRIKRIEFGEFEVTLPNGTRVARLAQSQDPASQFVQFVWLFTTHPQWLRQGTIVEMPLALPTNSLRRWRYLVGANESLQLPFGAIDAVHLTPLLDGPRRPNEYPFELWTAPTLQYLPVRMRVQLDENNYADLTLDSRPLQAAAASASAPASAASLAPAADPAPAPVH